VIGESTDKEIFLWGGPGGRGKKVRWIYVLGGSHLESRGEGPGENERKKTAKGPGEVREKKLRYETQTNPSCRSGGRVTRREKGDSHKGHLRKEIRGISGFERTKSKRRGGYGN